jgi:hypothetical protein
MPNLEDLSSQALQDFIGNKALGNALVTEGTNAATIKTTNAVDYQINGQVYTKAATDNIAMTAQPVQASGTTCYYLISIDAAGTVTTTKGVADSGLIPECPSAQAPLAVIKLVAAAAFTSGTTDLGAQDTWAQIAVLPKGRAASLLTFA